MAEKNPAVYGTVTGVDADGALMVELENGQRGSVEFQEISRQDHVRRENIGRMIGRHMGFVPGEVWEDGRVRLSGRAFEEMEYRRICDDFASQKRNIYEGKLISVTPDGKLAFFQLAQGVIGALHVSAFSLSRVESFHKIDLPKRMAVAVTGIDHRGWLSLSAKPAFGDFVVSVERLNLSEGQLIEGPVVNIMADGAAAVMLAPNLTVLIDHSRRVGPGDWVQVRVRRIDRAHCRIKAQMIARLEGEGRPFRYEEWVQPIETLDLYFDLKDFEERIHPRRTQAEPVSTPRTGGPETIEYAVSATRSPFSTYRNERVVRETRRPSRIQDIYFEARMGYLSEKHIRVAEAVEALKYSSAWQLRRYICLRDQLLMSDRELKGIIDRLVKHDVIGVLRFQNDEGSLLTRVLHPSLNYRALCGRNPRNFSPKDFMETSASSVKMYLAANQLLIGLMRKGENIGEIETHPFLRAEENDIRVRPRHMIRMNGGVRYLEAVRAGCEDEFIEKLRRYELMNARRREEMGVVVTMEDRERMQDMLARVTELRLSFPVWVTDDLSCLPETELTEIPAARAFGDVSTAAKALLQKLRQRIEDRG